MRERQPLRRDRTTGLTHGVIGDRTRKPNQPPTYYRYSKYSEGHSIILPTCSTPLSALWGLPPVVWVADDSLTDD
jgi:hypothetical protein